MELAKKLCQRDPATWATEGFVQKVSVAPEPTRGFPDCSNVLMDVLMDAVKADIIDAIYFDTDDEDDGSEATVSA